MISNSPLFGNKSGISYHKKKTGDLYSLSTDFLEVFLLEVEPWIHVVLEYSDNQNYSLVFERIVDYMPGRTSPRSASLFAQLDVITAN